MVERRRFLAGLAAGLAAGALGAQTSDRTWRIGYLSSAYPPLDGAPPRTLRDALARVGYTEGKNTRFLAYWGEMRADRLAVHATRLAEAMPDIIVAFGHPAAEALRSATATTPIVVFGAGDPAGTGLVASLGRPGGNLTGYNERSTELSAKRLELLKEILPGATRVGVLWNADNRAMTHQYREIEKVSSALRVTTLPHAVREPEDFDAAFAALARDRPDALLVVADSLTVIHRQRIFEFAARQGIPTIVESRDMVRDGALLSYGPSADDGAHRVAAFIDRILRGAKPGDLPIEQPTRFELVINAQTARTIGLALPAGVMMRADEMFH